MTKVGKDQLDLTTKPITSATFAGGTIDNMPIGQTTPNVGTFTNLSAANLRRTSTLTVTGTANFSGATVTGLGNNFQIKRRIITSRSNYTPTAGTAYVFVEALGGGGAGGGTPSVTAAQAAGGGGGAGAYRSGTYTGAQIGSRIAITIGVGGVGVTGGNGGNGRATRVGSLLTAPGGNGANLSPNRNNLATAIAAGGPASNLGTCTASDALCLRGAAGAYGTMNSYYNRIGGNGARTRYGTGGDGWNRRSAVTATGYGRGGGGARAPPNTAARAGGNGAAGVVVVTEYILS